MIFFAHKYQNLTKFIMQYIVYLVSSVGKEQHVKVTVTKILIFK